MRKLSGLAAALLLAATTSFAFAADLNLTFGPGRDATQPGKVTIQDMGSSIKVTLDMQPGPAGATTPQPAHIHVGGCPGVGAVKYPLTNVVNGKSETTINATVADLMASQHAINVHQSPTDAGKYTACVNLPLASANVAGALPRTGGLDGSLVLLAGAGLAGLGALLRRRSA